MFELNLFKLLVWAAWASAAGWLAVLVLTLVGLARHKPLKRAARRELATADEAPLVSVLVPARNEEGRVLAASVRSILAQDYERLEVIAVNDRSTDATGTILRRLSEEDRRLRVIEGAEPPAGWLGKPFALQQALERASGRWILATDADMIFAPSALRTALDYVLERQRDALTFIPHFESYSFWERVMIPTWSWVMLMYVLFYRVRSGRTREAVGIGGFFLIRRGALDSVGGYHALKNEVMEDMRLAERLKGRGARVAFEYAPDLVKTRMYTNFREMWECSTKNWFSGMKFSAGLALASVLAVYLFAVAPPLIALACAVGLATGADAGLWLLLIPLLLNWATQVFILISLNRRCRVPFVYALLTPLGFSVQYAMLLDSTLRIVSGRGVTWKGRKVYERAGGVRPPRFRQTPNFTDE
jgi:chlorobactene glucosyltransferase